MNRQIASAPFWMGVLSGAAMFMVAGVVLGMKTADRVDLMFLMIAEVILFINTVWCWTCV